VGELQFSGWCTIAGEDFLQDWRSSFGEGFADRAESHPIQARDAVDQKVDGSP